MTVWHASLHLLNFLTPAAVVGLMMALVEGVLVRHGWAFQRALKSFATYFLAGIGVLLLGLALLGRDGKLMTYAALVLTLGSLATWRMRV